MINYNKIINNIISEECRRFVYNTITTVLLFHSYNDDIVNDIKSINNNIKCIKNTEIYEYPDICIFYNNQYNINIDTIIEKMKRIEYGIFVLNTSLLQNINHKRELLKNIHIIKLIDIGNYIDYKDYCILICDNKDFSRKNTTEYYDISNLFTSNNIDIIDGITLDYLIGNIKPNIIKLTKYNKWFKHKNICIDDIEKYIIDKHKKYISKCYLLNNKRIDERLIIPKQFNYNYENINKFVKFEYKYKIIINSPFPDINNLYPLFDIIRDNDKISLIRNERFVNEKGKNIIVQKINIYKLLTNISDINIDVIGYQLYRYLLKGYNIDRVLYIKQ